MSVSRPLFLSDTAMILAAGFGARMRPLTLEKPKPLLEVGGQTMLDRAIDHLKNAGLRRVIVNGHYLADQIESHLKTRSDLEIIFSREDTILDTGGGVKNVRSLFGDKPFYLLGGDMPWLDGLVPALTRLADAWDDVRMDELLLLYPTDKAQGFGPNGDYMIGENGSIWRKDTVPPRSHVFISAQIVRPELYDRVNEAVFSNNKIFDAVEASGRLFGLEHDGSCYHVGTPEDLMEANVLLATGQGWA